MMKIQDVMNYYKSDLNLVEKYLGSYFCSNISPVISKITYHVISSGGKRLRPLLLLIAADICGADKQEKHYLFAAMLETIHTATLLHDDVIDKAFIRRGKLAVNKIWGKSTSILAGDFLYSRSFKLIADNGNTAIIKLMSKITNEMSEAEILQIVKNGSLNITEKDYFYIIQKKTAVLISAACYIGACLAKIKETKKIIALKNFGEKLGIAFQVRDDLLDFIAIKKEFGKIIGQDLIQGKITLPIIHFLKKCTEKERKFIKSLISNKKKILNNIDNIQILLQKYNSIFYCNTKALNLINEAQNILKIFPDSIPRRCLIAISNFIIEREF